MAAENHDAVPVTSAKFAEAHYEVPVRGGSTLLITPLNPGEGRELGHLFAAIDPWATYAYPAATLANFLSASEAGAPRLRLSVGEAIAGAAVIRTVWLRGPYLQFLGIVPEWQDRGLGSAFLQWMEQQARTAHERNLWVLASEINAGAVRLYERCGFAQTANLDDLACEGRSEILLRKRL